MPPSRAQLEMAGKGRYTPSAYLCDQAVQLNVYSKICKVSVLYCCAEINTKFD